MSRIADLDYESLHSEVINFFNQLLLDLKLQVYGKSPQELITADRLDEATRLLGKLEQCKKRMRFHR